jgi:hypothetical protein
MRLHDKSETDSTDSMGRRLRMAGLAGGRADRGFFDLLRHD